MSSVPSTTAAPDDDPHRAPGVRYELKPADPYSSHARVVRVLEAALAGRPRPRILDVGCGDALIKRTADLHRSPIGRDASWVGVDSDPAVVAQAAAAGMDARVADASRELPALPGPFDAVVLADVLEHFPAPDVVLRRVLAAACGPATVVVVSLPNVANLYVRAGLALGRFEYDERGGILDRAHLRFFTRRSAVRLLEGAGLRIVGVWPTPVPLYRVAGRWLGAAVAPVQRALFAATRVAPTLLGYQFVFEARRAG